jgi:hypothetical protein
MKEEPNSDYHSPIRLEKGIIIPITGLRKI